MTEKPTLSRNRYELISPLGQGGMACVFKAMDTRLKVEKAIKIPNHMCLTNKKIRDRFETEATTMAMLHHKNIVVVHDIQDEVYHPPNLPSISLIYMVMEMLPGGSLKDRIDDHGPLHPQQAIDAAIAMASGLGFAHDNNVVHRDVKLDNVLISSDNTLKVTDFGIAQIDGGSGMTQTGATMGTLAYMAPEQKLSSRRANALSDLYSVGASLYLMLTNRNPSELYALDIQERGFADLPEAAANLLGKCCNIDPKLRYQSANELIVALEELRPHFGTMPADTLPFYIPKIIPEMTDEDLLRQTKKVNTMWTTLLGIDPDEMSTPMPMPKVVTPNGSDTALDLDLFNTGTGSDTAIDMLGLDLTANSTQSSDLTNAGNIQNLQRPPNDHTTMKDPAVHATLYGQTIPPQQTKSNTGLIIGIVAALSIGVGVFFGMNNQTTVETAKPAVQIEPIVQPPPIIPEPIATEASPVEDKKAEASATPEPTVAPAPPKEEPVVEKKATQPTKSTAVVSVATKDVASTPEPEKSPENSATFGEIVINALPWANVNIGGKSATCQGKNTSNTPCTLKLPTGKNTIELIQGTDPTNTKILSLSIKENSNATKCWSFQSDSMCGQ